jgi:hypothetical protein
MRQVLAAHKKKDRVDGPACGVERYDSAGKVSWHTAVKGSEGSRKGGQSISACSKSGEDVTGVTVPRPTSRPGALRRKGRCSH